MSSQNQNELKQHLEWLESNGIIELKFDGFQFTETGKKTCKELGYYKPCLDLQKLDQRITEIKNMTEPQWEELFIKFISDAKVPAKLEGKNGDVYPGNKFSIPALKIFKKALQAGAIYDVLVVSTALYYKSSIRLKKAVGNYFIQGDWRSDYDALVQASSSGQLTEHIKSETNDGTQSAWKLG